MRRRPGSAIARCAAVVASLLVAASPAHAQDEPETATPPDWAGDVAFSLGNAALAGLAAGVVRTFRGGRFWPAFRDGAVGGLVAYGGRRLAAESFTGAGLLGRQAGAVGASMAGNAANGEPGLGRLVLPLGLIRLHLHGTPIPSRVHLKADVPTLLATTYLAMRSDTRLDWEATLSSGAPVFTSRVRWADGYWEGTQAAGAIWLRGNPDDPFPDVARADALAHERIHVLQYDFGLLLGSEPAEVWLAPRVPAGEWLHARFELGLHLAPWGLMNLLLPYDQRPWEHEAWFLSTVRAGS